MKKRVRHHLQKLTSGPRSWAIWAVVLLPWLAAAGFALATRHPTAPPLRQYRPTVVQTTPTPVPQDVSAAALAAHSGRNGQACWTAVSGTVYLIPDSSVWGNGEHIPSNGAVYCGQDTSSFLGQSPHGASVLKNLTKIGPLVP